LDPVAYQLKLFGTPELLAPGSQESLLPLSKPLAVLAYLAVEARGVSRPELVEIFWPGVDASHGKGSLRQALWTLRKSLDPDIFLFDEPLELAPGRIESDLDRFRGHVAAGELGEAGALWTGGLLEGLEFPGAGEWRRWVDDLRTREERSFGDALAGAANQAWKSGDLRTARSRLELAVTVQPYSPYLRRALVEVLLDARSYQAAADALASARDAMADGPDGEGWTELEDRLAALRSETDEDSGPPVLQTEFVGRTGEFSSLASAWRRSSSLWCVPGPPRRWPSRPWRRNGVSDGGRPASW
jgi:DNA-binding SARP family transcriptional activator